MAERILLNEYKTLSKEAWVNIQLNEENVMNWTVGLIVLNPDSLYHGGYFKAKMSFPSNYPYSPPGFKFLRPLFHPNIYADGKLCISILHAPGDDEMSGELAAERWSPAQRVESVLISILSLLDDAEVSSPANVDAGVMLRNDPEGYKEKVKQDVQASKRDIPEGFVMPTAMSGTSGKNVKASNDDAEFWYESGEEEDFGGSDSDEEMQYDDEDDEEEDRESEGEGDGEESKVD